jgi:hypothetical protein
MNLLELQGLLDRASRGEHAAVSQIKALKVRGKRGDKRALTLYNTLASLHWRRRSGHRWPKAERFYNRLMAKDKKAHQTLRRVLHKAKAGDPACLKAFRMLKAIHHQRKASLFMTGEGAPQTGFYPMPNLHRAGIDFSPSENVSISPEVVEHLVRVMTEARYSIPIMESYLQRGADIAKTLSGPSAAARAAMLDAFKPKVTTTVKPGAFQVTARRPTSAISMSSAKSLQSLSALKR